MPAPLAQMLAAELAASGFRPDPLLVKLVGSRIADRGKCELERVALAKLADSALHDVCAYHLGMGASFTEFLIRSLRLPRELRLSVASLGGIAHTIYALFDALLDESRCAPEIFGNRWQPSEQASVAVKQRLVLDLVDLYFRRLYAFACDDFKLRMLLERAIRKLYDAEVESAKSASIRRSVWWRKNALPILVMGLPGWLTAANRSTISFSEQIVWLGRIGEFLGWVDDFADFERDSASGQPNRLRDQPEDKLGSLARRAAAKGRRVLHSWDSHNDASAERDTFTVIVWEWLAHPYRKPEDAQTATTAYASGSAQLQSSSANY